MKQSVSKSNYYAYIYPWLVYLVGYEVLVMFEEELLLAKILSLFYEIYFELNFPKFLPWEMFVGKSVVIWMRLMMNSLLEVSVLARF